ncbi:sugar kinase [Ligilactobacillus equi]|uniref:sugar kinase n=1 Tax=Ligilactobacillus equi TaxID=137357 RepID=UPI002ED13CAE
MSKIVTFGEVLQRFKPEEGIRLVQATEYKVDYGGSEANVASSLALLGDDVALITKLPNNPLGQAATIKFRGLGVDTSKIHYGGARLGSYYFEKGASVRGTKVVYDRAGSSFATINQDEFIWSEILMGVDYFYFSGITAALSASLRKILLQALEYCKQHEVGVICDLNYRGRLWSPQEAQSFARIIMPYVTVCIANDEDFEQALGIKVFDGDMSRGISQKDSFIAGMRKVVELYPNVKVMASVLRDIYSVEESTWMALLLVDGEVYESPKYAMHVLEGVAGGDAFGAGLTHSLLNKYSNQKCINFAIAASVTKLTIKGDLNIATVEDIEAVMASGDAARISR